jgi:hypothetical protein
MIDEPTLQKCVDGELSDADQIEFLATIESTNGGWRTLALAYVEEQAWGTVLSVPPMAKELSTRPTESPARVDRFRLSRATMVLGLLVALTAGLLLGDMWRESRTGPRIMANRNANPIGNPPERSVVDTRRLPQPAQRSQVPAAQSQYVMDVVDADGQTQQMTYPVYDSPNTDSQWRRRLPGDIEQRLLRSGYLIQRLQRVQMIPLPDGGRIAFPVEMIRAQPIQ